MDFNEFLCDVKSLLKNKIMPIAGKMDKESSLDISIIKLLGDAKLLGMNIPKQYGGLELKLPQIALIHQEIGAAYISVENIVTVYGMVSQILLRSGTDAQKNKYLEKIANGNLIGAFALTEKENGSDFSKITTRLTCDNDKYILNGSKKWITLGEIADFYLVCARFDDKYSICIVEKDDNGFSRKPIKNTLGLRANMLAELKFDNCVIPRERIVCLGTLKFNMAIISTLTLARLTSACGAAGLCKACCDEAIRYASVRKCSGQRIGDFQLVKKMLTEIVAETVTAYLLCKDAAEKCETDFNTSLIPILMAKYVSTKNAVEVSNKAVQIMAAEGISDAYQVERHYRDAKLFEIIEGTTQIHEVMIGSEILKKCKVNI